MSMSMHTGRFKAVWLRVESLQNHWLTCSDRCKRCPKQGTYLWGIHSNECKNLPCWHVPYERRSVSPTLLDIQEIWACSSPQGLGWNSHHEQQLPLLLGNQVFLAFWAACAARRTRYNERRCLLRWQKAFSTSRAITGRPLMSLMTSKGKM